MGTFLASTIRTARKEYSCAACEAVLDGGLKHFVEKLTFAEKRAIVLARADKWRVKIGAKYVDYRGIQDGDLYQVKMRPEMQEMVSKYDWWPEE